MPKAKFNFANALLTWFDEHGRKNLPWQKEITPYRVWLSEVMLQQTQVETVIPYFQRFTQKYPQVQDLAAAPLDDVLHLWTGLGYYARARNLHKCAQTVVNETQGHFPDEVDALTALPGIGRSTACAIASIAFGKSCAILDGNVKRVLTRFHAVGGWPGQQKVEKLLWQHAEEHMPSERCADYTQAIMDLGATLCTRSRPACNRCPMQANCAAFASDTVDKYPEKKPKKAVPTKTTVMLIAQDSAGRLLLEQRPPQGIWGGLWSFREFDDVEQALTFAQALGKIKSQQRWADLRHAFSHYKLEITPLIVELESSVGLGEHSLEWLQAKESLQLGLAAPVKKLILSLSNKSDLLL